MNQGGRGFYGVVNVNNLLNAELVADDGLRYEGRRYVMDQFKRGEHDTERERRHDWNVEWVCG
jgi:hypothetical protein